MFDSETSYAFTFSLSRNKHAKYITRKNIFEDVSQFEPVLLPAGETL